MPISAVITADVVSSMTFSSQQRETLQNNLSAILTNHKHEFFRGDGLQVFVKDPREALLIALQIRTEARKISSLNDMASSIGIGEVKSNLKNLSTTNDPAFVISGRTFDTLEKNNARLAICSFDLNANKPLQIIAHFIDFLFERLTEKQAEVLVELLKGNTQKEIAEKINKSQPTINRHVQAAAWPEINRLIEEYKVIVSSIV